jgi:DNA-binding FadR family transcriptional regulator
VERTLQEHHAIHRAIKARDPEAARSWATVHIAGVEEWLRQILFAQPTDG